jgi:hypothetical protein
VKIFKQKYFICCSGFTSGISFSEEVFHFQRRYFVFRKGISFSKKVFRFQKRYFVFRGGISFSEKVFRFQRRYFVFRKGIRFSEEVFRFQKRYFVLPASEASQPIRPSRPALLAHQISLRLPFTKTVPKVFRFLFMKVYCPQNTFSPCEHTNSANRFCCLLPWDSSSNRKWSKQRRRLWPLHMRPVASATRI